MRKDQLTADSPHYG